MGSTHSGAAEIGPKRNWAKVGLKELGQYQPEIGVGPMLAQQEYFKRD